MNDGSTDGSRDAISALAAGFPEMKTVFRIFFPRMLAKLRPLERFLTSLPLGAQYYVHAVKRG